MILMILVKIAPWINIYFAKKILKTFKLFLYFQTSTGPYRSCAALLDISNPLKYLVEFSLVWLVLVWFGWCWYGFVGFCLVLLLLFDLVSLVLVRFSSFVLIGFG